MNIDKFFAEYITTSMGCTEPAAIGLSTAIGINILKNVFPSWINKEEINSPQLQENLRDVNSLSKLNLYLDKDLYRNALKVVIPNTGGIMGCDYAASMGLFCDPENKLELFKDLTEEQVNLGKKLVDQGKINIIPNYEWNDLHIEAEIYINNHKIRVHITGDHSNVSYIEIDGEILYERKFIQKSTPYLDQLIKLNLYDFLSIVRDLPDKSKSILENAIETNYKVYEQASQEFGKNNQKSIGLSIQELTRKGYLPSNYINSAKIKVATAVEGRMAGFPLKIMTCANSGNMGLISSIPFIEISKRFPKERDKLIEAVGLTHLLANFVSKYSGSLSALCGCIIKAGIGLSAGITYYLLDANQSEDLQVKAISRAINNMIGNITGIICDGANKTCALKSITAVDSAVFSSFLALNNQEDFSSLGIVNKDPLISIKNIGKISKSMKSTDELIIKDILDTNEQ
jgi:L-cysteine desulfidase